MDIDSLDLAKFLALCKGPRKSPPKGYPDKRSEYAIPETYQLPVDKKHIHPAITYFSSTHFPSLEAKRRAAARILRAAKRHGVKVSENDAVHQAVHGKKKMKKDWGVDAGGVAASAGAGVVY